MRYIFIILVGLLFFGCSSKQDIRVSDVKTSVVVRDLVDIPQNIEFYTKGINTKELYKIQKEYKKSYFSIWNIKRPSHTLMDLKWPFRFIENKQSYGENLLPIKKSFIDDMYKKSNFDKYYIINKKGLTLKLANIRALPTIRPILRDPSLAGEGFPFDYLQNSSINPNTPIFISHYSKDKQWVFIFSSFAYGWLKSDEVLALSDKNAKIWKSAKQIFIIKEGIPLFTESGNALFNTRIGMVFALVGEDKDNYTVLSPSAYKNSDSIFNKFKISKKIASKEILKIDASNLNTIINEVSTTNYGWGGMYGQRDCSSTLMDIYSSFGIWLPRNSSKQSKIGKIIDIGSLNEVDKIKIIKEKAIPFKTFLYKKGHIVLFVGIYKNEIIVFHNTWGIKTKNGTKEGRFIIGKSIFSTLKPGKELENYDKSAELLRNMKSMNIITR